MDGREDRRVAPAHLNSQPATKTVDWFVERLMSRHSVQSAQGDDEFLLVRRTE